MATPPPKAPDRFYDFRRTNIVFAWSSVALLVVTVLMVYFDYRKPWKRLQAEFRGLERQELARQERAERQRLNRSELEAARAQIDAETAQLAEEAEELDRLRRQIERLERKVYEADSAARSTKSLLDTARYQYDRTLQIGSAEEVAARRADVEKLAARLEEQRITLQTYEAEKARLEADLDEKLAGRQEAEARLEGLQRTVADLERRERSLEKGFDYFVLNAPLMDFLQPSLKVEQVVLSGLYLDINFTDIDRVDRCVTCHVAANRPGFDGESWRAPFRTHPRLDLFVGDTSPHPYSRFGCTVCHAGLDRATDFARAGHSPASAEQRAEWKERWGWKPQKYLETPILPVANSEAGCIACHAPEGWTPGSEVQDTGRELISRMGCFGCHQIDLGPFRDLPRVGPALDRIASKTEAAWAYRWIEAPREFRPTTFMPHFFFQPNVRGERNLARQRAEIAAIVAFLWKRSERTEYPAPPAGDAERGRALFETVGCTGCHILDADARRDDFFPQINRLHGPNLIRTGSKVDAGWLFAWLKDPKRYNPETRMPNLRLTDAEAADLTAFLMSNRDAAYENLRLPEVEPEVRDELVLHYLEATRSIRESQAALEAMSEAERDVYLGEQTVRKYGCYGCHNIRGFEGAKPIGVELTEEGSKPLHQFDFGHVHEVPHTRRDWIRTKLLTPRIWDRGKEEVKSYDELFKMPDFGMSEREAEAVVTNVLGFTKPGVLEHRKAGQSARGAALAAGRKLITRHNCRGCHLVEGRGHAIRTAIEDPGLLPPNLAAEGARVRSEWLFGFLQDPGQVRLRPWLTVRMPTFGFSDEEINALIGYFEALDDRRPFVSEPPPPSTRNLVAGQVLFDMLQCARCHPAGPAAAAALGVSSAELAPSLVRARERLRHEWVPSWIKDPQQWITGTNMPANFQRLEDGTYSSPLVPAIDAPMFVAQKRKLMTQFASEDELKAFLGDVDRVTEALRDHVWAISR